MKFVEETLLKHYFLYEYASKERTELTLRVIPPIEPCLKVSELENEVNAAEIEELKEYFPEVEVTEKMVTPVEQDMT